MKTRTLLFLVYPIILLNASPITGDTRVVPHIAPARGTVTVKKTPTLMDNSANNTVSQNGKTHLHGPEPAKIPTAQEIGIVEKLGQHVPLNLSFHREDGKLVSLNEFIDKPTIVALVFLSCRASCHLLLGGLASAISKLQLKAGEDYSTLTISFDPEDTPSMASEAKVNYIEAIGKPYPEETWRFLTGDKETIKRFTDSVGFRFRKERGGFTHTVALIVLSPTGKIIRYLYGTSFLPFDLSMAITEASEERAGMSVKRVLLYCFSYDPQEKRYVFNVLRVVGTATLIFVVALFIYLTVSSRSARKKG
jgi:protein SCO1/2